MTPESAAVRERLRMSANVCAQLRTACAAPTGCGGTDALGWTPADEYGEPSDSLERWLAN
jgi:hypothetical protein